MSGKSYTLSAEVLDEVLKHIEETDQLIEWERGDMRSLQKVIDDNDMPDVYYKLIALKKER